MDLPKFRIGNVSKMLGIAPETIRYYERKKIIRPSKDTGSGYRQFDLMDMCLLTRTRAYLHYGFSLEEAKELLAAPGLEVLHAALQTREKELEQSIFEDLTTLNGLRKKLADVHNIKKNLGRFSLQSRPAMLCLTLFEDGCPLNDETGEYLPPHFLDNQLVTFAYLEFDKDKLEKECKDAICDVGMAVLESDAPAIGVQTGGVVRALPACPCLYTAIPMRAEQKYGEALRPVLDFARTRGLCLAGNVICRTIAVHEDGDSYLYYRDVWLPIVESKLNTPI